MIFSIDENGHIQMLPIYSAFLKEVPNMRVYTCFFVIMAMAVVFFVPLPGNAEGENSKAAQAVEQTEGVLKDAAQMGIGFELEEGGADEPAQLPPDEFYKAKIVEVVGETFNSALGRNMLEQEFRAEILEGPDKGEIVTVYFQLAEGASGKSRLNEGDKIVVVRSGATGESQYYLSDVYRMNGLWVLLGIFFVLVIFLTRLAGVRAIISLGVSLIAVVYYLVPKVLADTNILITGFVTVVILATMSLFFSHGLNKRTTIAFAATMITALFAFLMTKYSIVMLNLFGLGTEEAFFLRAAPGVIIDLGEILILGIIISVMGILDDVTTAQAATIEEIYKANPALGVKELIASGFSVGKEHILSLVNTLVLVYTGASLPLLMLLHIYERPAWLVVNSELFMEEIVKILMGSLALLVAVPITTLIAAWYFGRKKVL